MAATQMHVVDNPFSENSPRKRARPVWDPPQKAEEDSDTTAPLSFLRCMDTPEAFSSPAAKCPCKHRFAVVRESTSAWVHIADKWFTGDSQESQNARHILSCISKVLDNVSPGSGEREHIMLCIFVAQFVRMATRMTTAHANTVDLLVAITGGIEVVTDPDRDTCTSVYLELFGFSNSDDEVRKLAFRTLSMAPFVGTVSRRFCGAVRSDLDVEELHSMLVSECSRS